MRLVDASGAIMKNGAYTKVKQQSETSDSKVRVVRA